MNKMPKKDLMSDLSTTTGMSQTQCDTVLSAFAELVAEKNHNEDTSVTLMGLGTFCPNHKAARAGRNPATGEALQIAAKTVIKFKAVASLVKKS